jgi:hypothetical protein
MEFIVVRLGKDSVSDIREINGTDPATFAPYDLGFTCKQVEHTISAGDFVLLYLGSDNNKGIPTDWKQGLRAFGRLENIEGWENFQSECTLTIKLITIFDQSYDQFSFLEESPDYYKYFSKYPIIGVKSSRNNSVQKVNDDERENTSALLTALSIQFAKLRDDLTAHAPELLSMLDFIPPGDKGSGTGETHDDSSNSEIVGTNTIFYGAPGTGKSHAIEKSTDPSRTFRTVFHSETMNADFIGSIKPVTTQKSSGESTVSYEFIPGPFLQSLIVAIEDPSNEYWLVIEELNRAPAASVFGEVFQLLDRDSAGRSEYEIGFPDSICKQFVNGQVSQTMEKLYIPNNLSIAASMNSSDQGVQPLDTAFKRRWSFEYLPINFEKGCTEGVITVVLDDRGGVEISWMALALAINSILAGLDVPEDRHLGPFFLSANDILSPSRALAGKLFIYLWDDVLRHGLRHRVFASHIRTYGQLIESWDAGEPVFSDDLTELLRTSSAGSGK